MSASETETRTVEGAGAERFRCRVVGRSSNNANSNGGLVYLNANNVSSNSNSNNGTRLENKGTYRGVSFLHSPKNNRNTATAHVMGDGMRREP